jgi:hypothetical protein
MSLFCSPRSWTLSMRGRVLCSVGHINVFCPIRGMKRMKLAQLTLRQRGRTIGTSPAAYRVCCLSVRGKSKMDFGLRGQYNARPL